MNPSEPVDERIEHVILDANDGSDLSMFLSGPGEFLVAVCAEQLRKTKEWAALFGCTESDPTGFIDSYQRQDYPIRALPALRLYSKNYEKQFESWFIEGDITADVIFPASLRRDELQQIQDTVTAALLQQFRRTEFFNLVTSRVPGLNEFGKRFLVDKSLGFEWDDETIVPLTQIRINFRIDLREWDRYLESTNRTKEDPFEYTLANLEKIVSIVQGLRDTGEVETSSVGIDQSVKNVT